MRECFAIFYFFLYHTITYFKLLIKDNVAEFVVSVTLNTIRRISEAIDVARSGEWESISSQWNLFWMCGESKTIYIILGRKIKKVFN